jgi:hypothetical protein
MRVARSHASCKSAFVRLTKLTIYALSLLCLAANTRITSKGLLSQVTVTNSKHAVRFLNTLQLCTVAVIKKLHLQSTP